MPTEFMLVFVPFGGKETKIEFTNERGCPYADKEILSLKHNIDIQPDFNDLVFRY